MFAEFPGLHMVTNTLCVWTGLKFRTTCTASAIIIPIIQRNWGTDRNDVTTFMVMQSWNSYLYHLAAETEFLTSLVLLWQGFTLQNQGLVQLWKQGWWPRHSLQRNICLVWHHSGYPWSLLVHRWQKSMLTLHVALVPGSATVASSRSKEEPAFSHILLG
jgi:hypothetical protein